MKRAVLYSRFSTNLQNEKSIADQEAVLTRYAANHGFTIVAKYSDAAQSGATIIGRSGLLKLLAAAAEGKFDVVLVEELDRLSRDMADLANIHKELTAQGVEIVAIHEGVASTITVGLRGLVGQLFREDNARKIRRGLEGKVRGGMSAGGKAYGYKPDLANKGRLIIDPEEAAVVLRIFEEFAAGRSAREICQGLNADRVPPPRGNQWQHAAIYGWEARKTGILRNQLYDGKIVWNKSRMIKDPSTGKRLSRPNPPSEWRITEAEELRIVPHDLFERVAKMIEPKDLPAEAKGKFSAIVRMKRPQRLLSGLLRCSGCGGGMSARGSDKSGRVRIRCSTKATGGICPDPQDVYLDMVEAEVLALLRQQLADPDSLVTYVEEYNKARLEFARGEIDRRAKAERKVKALDGEIERTLDLLIKGVGNKVRLEERYADLCREFDEAKEILEATPTPPSLVTLHPAAIAAYKSNLDDLSRLLKTGGGESLAELQAVLRELVAKVVVTGDAGKVDVKVYGKLRMLLSEPLRVSGAYRGGPLSVQAVVAEEGFEPPTHGL